MWYLKMMGEYYFFIFMSFMKKFVKSIYILENITTGSSLQFTISFSFSKKKIILTRNVCLTLNTKFWHLWKNFRSVRKIKTRCLQGGFRAKMYEFSRRPPSKWLKCAAFHNGLKIQKGPISIAYTYSLLDNASNYLVGCVIQKRIPCLLWYFLLDFSSLSIC